ncbi:MAG: PD40 domain-containing protein, partial [Planctomycetes bacterium]|nr:PD40 domain-containing protein [Planctomycetota bacterium]
MRATLRGHESSITFLAFSPDGKTLASVSGDIVKIVNNETQEIKDTGTVKLWDVSTHKERTILKGKIRGSPRCMAFSPDGKILASAGNGGFVHFWDVPSGREVGRIKQKGLGLDVEFSPTGKTVAVGGSPNAAGVWNVPTGEQV